MLESSHLKPRRLFLVLGLSSTAATLLALPLLRNLWVFSPTLSVSYRRVFHMGLRGGCCVSGKMLSGMVSGERRCSVWDRWIGVIIMSRSWKIPGKKGSPYLCASWPDCAGCGTHTLHFFQINPPQRERSSFMDHRSAKFLWLNVRIGGNDLGCNHWMCGKARSLQGVSLGWTGVHLLRGSVWGGWKQPGEAGRSDKPVKCAALCSCAFVFAAWVYDCQSKAFT